MENKMVSNEASKSTESFTNVELQRDCKRWINSDVKVVIY